MLLKLLDIKWPDLASSMEFVSIRSVLKVANELGVETRQKIILDDYTSKILTLYV
jgi:hypothetical protein